MQPITGSTHRLRLVIQSVLRQTQGRGIFSGFEGFSCHSGLRLTDTHELTNTNTLIKTPVQTHTHVIVISCTFPDWIQTSVPNDQIHIVKEVKDSTSIMTGVKIKPYTVHVCTTTHKWIFGKTTYL